MALMVLDVLWGVITRYALGGQADWTEELARFLLIWIGLLGVAYASGQKMHLAIDLLRPRLKGKRAIQVQYLIHGLVIAFALLVMIVGGGRLLYISQTLGQQSAALQIPLTVVYAVLPLSGLFIIYYKINALITLKSP
jgi:TRAP-type C4-dicarboxylate transport system permease small subunit